MNRIYDRPPGIFWPLLSLGIALAAFYTALFVLLLFNLLTHVAQARINRGAETLQQREMHHRDADEWLLAEDTSEDRY